MRTVPKKKTKGHFFTYDFASHSSSAAIQFHPSRFLRCASPPISRHLGPNDPSAYSLRPVQRSRLVAPRLRHHFFIPRVRTGKHSSQRSIHKSLHPSSPYSNHAQTNAIPSRKELKTTKSTHGKPQQARERASGTATVQLGLNVWTKQGFPQLRLDEPLHGDGSIRPF